MKTPSNQNEYFSVENNAAGIKQAIKAQLPIVIANPIQVKKFAGAIGRKAKTDKRGEGHV